MLLLWFPEEKLFPTYVHRLTLIYKELGYENCTVPLYTTKSQSHKNFTISVPQDKSDILEDDTSVLRREMFLKIAGPDEKPEAGISRSIYEIKPVVMLKKNVPCSQLTQNFCAVMHVFVTPAVNS